jgi:putative transposase
LEEIKSLFSRRVAKSAGLPPNKRGEHAVWQTRFWEHTIRGDSDFERHSDYIHYNPVKHGLVSRVTDWPYSSFHRYVRLAILPHDWAGDARETGHGFGERAG